MKNFIYEPNHKWSNKIGKITYKELKCDGIEWKPSEAIKVMKGL